MSWKKKKHYGDEFCSISGGGNCTKLRWKWETRGRMFWVFKICIVCVWHKIAVLFADIVDVVLHGAAKFHVMPLALATPRRGLLCHTRHDGISGFVSEYIYIPKVVRLSKFIIIFVPEHNISIEKPFHNEKNPVKPMKFHEILHQIDDSAKMFPGVSWSLHPSRCPWYPLLLPWRRKMMWWCLWRQRWDGCSPQWLEPEATKWCWMCFVKLWQDTKK